MIALELMGESDMPSIRTRLAAASALALMTAAAPAMAQEFGWVTIGEPLQGVLEDGDERGRVAAWNNDEYLYDDYLMRTEAGQRFTVELSSADFDSYVTVYLDGNHERDEPLTEDDDSAGYPDAMARFTAQEEGLYRIRVRGFGSQSRGAYTLNVTRRAPAPREIVTPIASRGEIAGELAQGDAELDAEQLYDAYRFRAHAGERIDIRLDSTDFDPVLYVGRQGTGGGFQELAANDDSGGSLNSRIRFTAPETGDYLIRAASYWSQEEGAYVLSLSEAPPPVSLSRLVVGETVRGRLDEEAMTDDYGAGYVGYALTARAGQRVAVAMSSNDFDSFVELGRLGPGGFESIASDDDGGDRLNSRLVHTFAEGGEYELRARSYSGSATGAYRLEVSEIAPDPEPAPLAFGRSVRGEITDDSAQDANGGRFDAYRFSGREGQRVQIVMRSGDFDTVLQIGRAGGDFEGLGYDDDGLGEGLNSRLNFTLPETGDYVVRASSFGGRRRGLYALELTDRGAAPVAGSIMIGATVRGSLTEADNVAGDASFYDDYRFQAEAGDRLRLTMVSNEFDAYLFLGEGLAEDFVMIASDDDSLSDTNALIEHTFDHAGWYTLRANSYAPNSTGAYVVTIERRE